MDVKAALKVAVARLGDAELRDKQREAIESFVSGKDVFVALPYGVCMENLSVWTFDTMISFHADSANFDLGPKVGLLSWASVVLLQPKHAAVDITQTADIGSSGPQHAACSVTEIFASNPRYVIN